MATKPGATYTSTARLYLNAAGQVVGADDPSRATLLVAAGGSIPLAVAQRYGLGLPAPAPEPAPAPAPADEAPPNDAAPVTGKAISGPPANKAQRGPAGTK